jgi:hypothetical protein
LCVTSALVPRLAALLAIVLLGLAAAPLAQAQIGPNVPKPLTEEPPPPPPAPQKFDEGGLSTLQKVLIFGSAALVLAAIAFVIVRDARRAAPVDERSHGGGPSRGSSAAGATAKSARERERQQRAKRARAKAARQQRKRNRP